MANIKYKDKHCWIIPSWHFLTLSKKPRCQQKFEFKSSYFLVYTLRKEVKKIDNTYFHNFKTLWSQICSKHLQEHRKLSYFNILYFFSSGNHRRWWCSFIQHKNRYISMKCYKKRIHILLIYSKAFSSSRIINVIFSLSQSLSPWFNPKSYHLTRSLYICYNLAVWSYDITRSPKISPFMPKRY